MKLLHQKDWVYAFYRTDDRYQLQVVCGRAAVYELSFELNAKEVKAYEKRGTDYLEELAWEVQATPDKFEERKGI